MDDATKNNISYDDIDASEIYNREEGNPQLLNAAITKGIREKYPEITPVSSGDALHAFERNLVLLSNYLLETKSKIVRQENRNLSVKIICAFVLAFCRLQPERALTSFKQEILSQEAYLSLRDRINDIMRLLNKSMIRKESFMNLVESLPYLETLDQMFDMMGIDPSEVKSENEKMFPMESKKNNLESIKETFLRTLNRLNEHKYYNERYER